MLHVLARRSLLAAGGCLPWLAVSCGTPHPATPPPPMTEAQRAEMQRADPQMRTVLTALAELNPKPIETLSATEARRQPSATDAVYQVIQEKGDAAPKRLPPVGKVEMKLTPGPNGAQTPVRVYTPKGVGPFPVVVYFHGGGWVIADIDTYDSSARALCAFAKAVVVAVEYRKAPEHKFPVAHEDCYAALQYVIANAAQFNGDPARAAVAGESAGGNMATAVCLMAKERSGRMPIQQVLIYPVTNYAFDTASYRENANAKPLNAAMMRWFFEKYLNSPAEGENKLISPLRASAADLRGLPPATVITAQIDPLHDEGVAYAQKLKEAGVEVQSRDYAGVTHEFFGMAAVVDKAKAAESFAALRLRQAFAGAH